MKYIFLSLLFIVPSIPKNRPVTKKAVLSTYEDKKSYIQALDSAIIKERNKNSRLRKEVVYKIDYLVHQQNGRLEENIHRLASN